MLEESNFQLWINFLYILKNIFNFLFTPQDLNLSYLSLNSYNHFLFTPQLTNCKWTLVKLYKMLDLPLIKKINDKIVFFFSFFPRAKLATFFFSNLWLCSLYPILKSFSNPNSWRSSIRIGTSRVVLSLTMLLYLSLYVHSISQLQEHEYWKVWSYVTRVLDIKKRREIGTNGGSKRCIERRNKTSEITWNYCIRKKGLDSTKENEDQEIGQQKLKEGI